MPHETPRTTPTHTTSAPHSTENHPDHPDHRRPHTHAHAHTHAHTLTGALAIAALVAALVALWQTQSTPLRGRAYCWGAWPEGEAPFRRGDRDRIADEDPPAPGRPTGRCSLRWHSGRGGGMEAQRLDLRLGTGPREAGERRTWLGELFTGGDVPLPDGLPGFTAAASGTGALVLPESCDVDGRPSVITLKSAKALPVTTAGELLVAAANKATEKTSCTTLPPLRLRQHTSPTTAPEGCGIAGLSKQNTKHVTGTELSETSDFHSCVIKEARFTATARPRLVALFDGLTGDRPPAPGWRAHGSIDAAGALVRADCGGRPTVFAMRSAPGRPRTGPDDPREVFQLYVDAVAVHMGCAPLRAG
ncbi:hypothetical protein ACSNOH_30070 [Streptomyces sp. URMC 127]|uniref:hypothetical protein n=1 Tax=Streptomyces sp. URMC 127 TaxID=3423402 RepID=UPI003F1DF59B